MSVSNLSGHWTDDQLIQHLYGLGPEDGHLDGCGECRGRLSAMQARRRGVEASDPEVSFEFLAAQRRKIYARITEPVRWFSGQRMRRWASAAATLLVLGGGVVMYEQNHQEHLLQNRISDAQLAQQVSNMAEESEAQPTAPLQGLFEE